MSLGRGDAGDGVGGAKLMRLPRSCNRGVCKWFWVLPAKTLLMFGDEMLLHLQARENPKVLAIQKFESGSDAFLRSDSKLVSSNKHGLS